MPPITTYPCYVFIQCCSVCTQDLLHQLYTLHLVELQLGIGGVAYCVAYQRQGTVLGVGTAAITDSLREGDEGKGS